MKLKDSKSCQCRIWHDPSDDTEPVYKPCRFGSCTIVTCPQCGLELCSWGLVACPCKKNENGTLRWFKYPDMGSKTHVAVKENKIMRKPKRTVRKSATLR